MSVDLACHEMTHVLQQGQFPDAWWNSYAIDPEFRYEQELEAYRNQYNYLVCVKGRINAMKHAQRFAAAMASPMYGNMCTYDRALVDIISIHEIKK